MCPWLSQIVNVQSSIQLWCGGSPSSDLILSYSFLLWLWVREFLRHLCIDCCLRIKLYRQSTQWEISQMPESQEKDLVGIQTRSQNPERCLKVCISNLHVDFCFLVVFGKLAFGIPTFLGFIPLSQRYHHFELDGLSHAHNPRIFFLMPCAQLSTST